LIDSPAPDFTLPTDTGPLTLSSLRGKKVVLYFYPKDLTPGCTIQACSFRDAWPEFEKRGATVIGVSKDTPKKHASFREKQSLPFPLVSDDGSLCEAYGVWREKTLYGRKYMGIARVTFLIDEHGKVRKTWDPAKPAGHAAEVLKAIDAL
jgi:peroxiredoxin Q/BCP